MKKREAGRKRGLTTNKSHAGSSSQHEPMGGKGGKKCLGFSNCNLPISGDFYFARNAFSRIFSVCLRDADFLFASETLRMLFLDD